MITRLHAWFIALGFSLGFVISLSLDLHGAFAVALSIGAFAFASAAIDQRTKFVRFMKIIIGAILIFMAIVVIVRGSGQNRVFLFTVFFCGVLLSFDSLVLWLTKPSNDHSIQPA